MSIDVREPTELAPPEPSWKQRPKATPLLVSLVVAGLVAHAISNEAVPNPAELLNGAGNLWSFLQRAFPPNTDRLVPVLEALLVTFEMALTGTIVGVALSIPLAVVAARNTTPNRAVYLASRWLIAFFRTVPDLVWGLLFVIAVGLGPPAGFLAITVDVIGFCGRFFADAIEEMDDGTLEGLRSTGASRTGVIVGAVLPSCMPSFVASSMFALESATRSSVVLGVVGAGGIGVELATSMQLLRYDEAITILLAIFVVVLGVERASAALRKRIL
jgi:phosphonate transport system permease protein